MNSEKQEINATIRTLPLDRAIPTTMEGYGQNITCSLLVSHGIPDPLFNVEGVKRIYDEAASTDKTLKLWKDGNHCVTNHATETITLFTDFFTDKLK